MLLVIGLDGASYKLCEQWMGEGYLPNLARIKREGVWGPLRSTTPSVSPVAWSTFMTGKNPGGHGVFGFFVPERPGPHLPPSSFRPVTSQDCRGKRFWEQMNEAGLTTGIVGVPVTYPVAAVRGHIIAGLLAPSLSSPGAVQPPQLVAEIQARVGGYRIVPRGLYVPGRESVFLEEVRRTLELRGRLATYLLDAQRCDVHVFVLYETDIVQHKMWQFMDASHPRYTARAAQQWGQAIREVYEQADGIVGEVMQRVGPDDTLVVLSDHGAGPLHGTVHLNKWLREEGYLVMRRGWRQWAKRLAGERRFVARVARLAGVIGANRWIGLGQGLRRAAASGFLHPGDVDWAATRAYNLGFEGAIYVVGESYEATTEELVGELSALRDPATREVLVEAACPGREVYHGEFREYAPGIVLRSRAGAYSASQKAFAPSLVGLGSDSGTHRPTGIFGLMGRGTDIVDHQEDLRIEHVAPLLLRIARVH